VSATNLVGNLKQLADAALQATACGDYAAAQQQYQQAVALAPDNSTLLYNYASLARIMGDLDQAQALLDKVIGLTPADSSAWLMRSQLRRWNPSNNHLDALTNALQQLPANASPRQRVELHYALCKEYEDCENFSKAREHLEAGAALKRRHINYDVNDDLATLTALKRAVTAPTSKPSHPENHGQPTPIFIISLPRAGSTLLERMLACDSAVYAAGELPYFPQLLGRALQHAYVNANGPKSRPRTKAELVSYADNIDWLQLGRDYLAQLPQHSWVIDKLPLNYLNIGFIRRALPQARIIYLQRDAGDHELALLKHLFNQAYPWSYDRQEIRRYRHAVEELCNEAYEKTGNDIHRLTYEQLVTQPSKTLTAVTDYCGLQWDESMLQQALRFNETNQQPSTTGSSSQIRHSLHSRSIGLAKRYRS